MDGALLRVRSRVGLGPSRSRYCTRSTHRRASFVSRAVVVRTRVLTYRRMRTVISRHVGFWEARARLGDGPRVHASLYEDGNLHSPARPPTACLARCSRDGRADNLCADDRDADVLALAKPGDGSLACTAGSGYAYRMGVSTGCMRQGHAMHVYVRKCGTCTGMQPAPRTHDMCMYTYNAGPLTGYAPSTHRVLLGERLLSGQVGACRVLRGWVGTHGVLTARVGTHVTFMGHRRDSASALPAVLTAYSHMCACACVRSRLRSRPYRRDILPGGLHQDRDGGGVRSRSGGRREAVQWH